jgi:predicted transcriptional regulator
MRTATTDDVADILAGRERVLNALAAEPASKRTLEDRLSVSRSTVDRAIRDLQSHSLVVYEDRQYHLTAAGRYGLTVHEEAGERLSSLAAASDVLASVDRDAPLDADFVAGAEVVRASPPTPDAVVSRLLDSVARTDHVDGVAAVALMGHLDAFYDEATADGGSVRLLVEHGLLDSLVTANGDPLRRGIEDPAVSLERVTVPFDVGLWLADDREAGVVVYTETGVKAVLVNDDPAAVEWARETFERVAETATPFERNGR